jgi:hypothetical protein
MFGRLLQRYELLARVRSGPGLLPVGLFHDRRNAGLVRCELRLVHVRHPERVRQPPEGLEQLRFLRKHLPSRNRV